MWVKFQHQKSGCVVIIAVCYVPPVGLSRDVDGAEHLLVLEEQTKKFQAEGQVVLCGDFNARCGGLRDVDGEMLDRCSVDMVKNEQGEMLVECMKSTGLCFVNGRQGPDEFTCISSKGRSVVDYCLVPCEEVANVENFIVRTTVCHNVKHISVRVKRGYGFLITLCSCGTCGWMTLWLI